MTKLFSFFNPKSLIENTKRFPLSFLYILIISGIFIYINHSELHFRDKITENLLRINLSLITTFFLSLGFYLFSETEKHSKLKTCIFQIFSVIFGIFFYYYFGNNFGPHNTIITFGFIIFVFFSPYLLQIFSKKYKKENYFAYLSEITGIFIYSFFVGTILMFLGNIAIFSVVYLFDIKNDFINDKLPISWAIISASFFAPLYGLSKFPKQVSKLKSNDNIFNLFILKFIGIPFIFIFFLILYAYSIKVLLNFGDWPKGQITWLVVAFSSFGYLFYMFSSFYEEKNKYINLFRKIFPYVVIPQIFMLFYAIYLRINQYDITINRYLIVVFGVWLLIISIYFIFSKRKNIVFIPFILTIFTVIISVGPWSLYNLSEQRQFSRLENNLKKAGILKNGEIIYLNNFDDIKPELSKNIADGVRYLCDFRNCEKIKNLFSKEYKELEKNNKKVKELNKREIVDFINNKIKVRRIKRSGFYKYENIRKDIFPIDIKGYNEFYDIISFNKLNKTFSIKKDKKIKIDFDLIDEILKKKNNEQIEIKFEKDGKKYKIIIENVDIEKENKEINYIEGFLLIGEK